MPKLTATPSTDLGLFPFDHKAGLFDTPMRDTVTSNEESLNSQYATSSIRVQPLTDQSHTDFTSAIEALLNEVNMFELPETSLQSTDSGMYKPNFQNGKPEMRNLQPYALQSEDFGLLSRPHALTCEALSAGKDPAIQDFISRCNDQIGSTDNNLQFSAFSVGTQSTAELEPDLPIVSNLNDLPFSVQAAIRGAITALDNDIGEAINRAWLSIYDSLSETSGLSHPTWLKLFLVGMILLKGGQWCGSINGRRYQEEFIMILKRVLGFHEPASENGLQSDGEITGGSSEESLAYEDSSSENSSSGDSEETDYPKSRAIIIVGEY